MTNTTNTTPTSGPDTAAAALQRTAEGQEGYRAITRRVDPFALVQAKSDDIPF